MRIHIKYISSQIRSTFTGRNLFFREIILLTVNFQHHISSKKRTKDSLHVLQIKKEQNSSVGEVFLIRVLS